jgi:hypothetical protein
MRELGTRALSLPFAVAALAAEASARDLNFGDEGVEREKTRSVGSPLGLSGSELERLRATCLSDAQWESLGDAQRVWLSLASHGRPAWPARSADGQADMIQTLQKQSTPTKGKSPQVRLFSAYFGVKHKSRHKAGLLPCENEVSV